MNRKRLIRTLLPLLLLAVFLIFAWFVAHPLTPRSHFYLQVDKAKEIGAKGIELFDVPCFYDEGYLDDALDYIAHNKSMKVILFLEYFNRSYSFPFPSEAWDRSGFPDDEDNVNLYCKYLENVSKIEFV